MLTQERKEELKKEAETIWLQLMEETNGNAENGPAEPLQCSEQEIYEELLNKEARIASFNKIKSFYK